MKLNQFTTFGAKNDEGEAALGARKVLFFLRRFGRCWLYVNIIASA